MNEILHILLNITLVVFMVGNLLGMGLTLQLDQVLGGLRNVRFVALSVLWGFAICPALAWLLTRVLPLEQPYAVGMLLMGMTPCAPFLPMMVEKARGDMNYAAVMMLLTAVLTIAYMPLAVPLMIPGFSADAWAIARPLVLFLLIPLLAGFGMQRAFPRRSGQLYSLVKKVTGIATILMLVVCLVLYGKAFGGAVGSFAFATQILFFAVVSVVPYVLGPGLHPSQKSVLALGMTTRNLGAALAPLIAVTNVDHRAIVMVAIGIPMQVIAALLAANYFARRATKKAP